MVDSAENDKVSLGGGALESLKPILCMSIGMDPGDHDRVPPVAPVEKPNYQLC